MNLLILVFFRTYSDAPYARMRLDSILRGFYKHKVKHNKAQSWTNKHILISQGFSKQEDL